MIFLDLKFLVKSDFLGSMKDAGNFWVAKKTEGFFWLQKKGLRDFGGYAKKSCNIFGQTNSELKL